MLARMDARQWGLWCAYHGLEPFGEERADLRAGITSATFANCFRGKNTPAFTPKQFMPNFDPPRERTAKDVERDVARAMAYVMATGGKVVTAGAA